MFYWFDLVILFIYLFIFSFPPSGTYTILMRRLELYLGGIKEPSAQMHSVALLVQFGDTVS